ncbi:MAG: HupH hydrogenase expression protein [Firmicutes bacterium]|nr:HupH hydrogenase expression protein [Bacillota bacterium]
MSKATAGLSPAALAVLEEINQALTNFLQHRQEWTIFSDKMALSLEERQMIRDFLGQGSIKIELNDTAEPAEWVESGTSGVWFGVFYDQNHKPVLETIEICAFPNVAGAQMEDILQDQKSLSERLSG